jgi:hypothetical protein
LGTALLDGGVKEQMNNPFRKLLKQDPPVLVGRDFLIEAFLEGATRPGQPDSFQLTALRTMGATTLLRALAHPKGVLSQRRYASSLMAPYTSHDNLIFIYLDFMRYDHPAGIAAWIYEQTKARPQLWSYWPETEEADPATNLRHMLIQAEQERRRVVWLCDHFDHAFEKVAPEQATALRPLVTLASFITVTEQSLTELNRDAAASLFSGQLIPCHLNPLTTAEADELLRKAEGITPRDLLEYKALLPWAGHHPYFILRSCEQWYDIRQKYRNVTPDLLSDLAKDSLLNLFRPDFVRFWNHVKAEQPLLIRLANTEDGIAIGEQLGPIDRLVDKGLVVFNGRSYHPFSRLWANFIRSEAVERQIVKSANKFQRKAPKLTAQEQALVDFLETQPNRICSYADLITAVWREDDTPENRHRLRQVVLRLRQKLKRWPNRSGELRNHRDQGYEWRTQT